LGLLLVGYLLMLFIENVIAYNLLNVIIWFIVGLCHSESMLSLDDQDIRKFFKPSEVPVNETSNLKI